MIGKQACPKQGGEEIILARNGKPKAKLVPCNGKTTFTEPVRANGRVQNEFSTNPCQTTLSQRFTAPASPVTRNFSEQPLLDAHAVVLWED